MSEFQELLRGYQRFRNDRYPVDRQRWENLAGGQQPPIMVIGCCDSRVDPTIIFDAVPGQVFVLRNVANLVPPYETGGGLHGVSAALEFAVTKLEVAHVVVLGHGACGGVTASLQGQGADGTSFIGQWIALLDEARARVEQSGATDPQRALELEGVRASLANLRTFPFVREREQAGTLQLHGCHFAISEGCLYELDEDGGEFRQVPEVA